MNLRRYAILFPLMTLVGGSVGCGKNTPPPPVDDTRVGQTEPYSAQEKKPGITTGQKVVLLTAAAAAYYMYKHHQNAKAATGPDGQYYLSKNGRVYYRDADHRAHWVTPPAEGLSVPAHEADEYKQFQGYNGATAGRDLVGLGNDE